MPSHIAPTFDWSPLLADFAAAGADPVVRHEDGWSLSLYCALTSAPRLLAHAPAAFTERASGREPLYDHTGEDVDDETVSGVSASDEALSILTWVDHWQAGLCATLAVYDQRAAYESALCEAGAPDDDPDADLELDPDQLADSWWGIEE